MKLTRAQRRALGVLDACDEAYASNITDLSYGYVHGATASRLRKMGLATFAGNHYTYSITDAGRRALSDGEV